VTFFSAGRVNSGGKNSSPEDVYENTYSDKLINERSEDKNSHDKDEQTKESFFKANLAEGKTGFFVCVHTYLTHHNLPLHLGKPNRGQRSSVLPGGSYLRVVK
jgi:hypothetical protein